MPEAGYWPPTLQNYIQTFTISHETADRKLSLQPRRSNIELNNQVVDSSRPRWRCTGSTDLGIWSWDASWEREKAAGMRTLSRHPAQTRMKKGMR